MSDLDTMIQPARLTAMAGGVRPEEFVLDGGSCTLGRSSLCQVLIDRNVVSRLHARIVRESVRFILSDLGSTNGTFVNGNRLQGTYVLRDRDQIGLGSPAPLLRFTDPDPTHIPAQRLRYDERLHIFLFDDQPLHLPQTQLRLLLHLYRHSDTVCTRESCTQAIWGHNYDPGADADRLDRAINGVRSRLRELAGETFMIETRRGEGYILRLGESA
ncbi:MAG: FHA domain-containing protein [Oscillochloridaceae bacterium umkhey_bin13]